MKQLEFYNTGSGRREVFQPIDEGRVRMYLCGPTVYDRAHIGNARAAVVFDVLCRLLRLRYGSERVVYVRNITDIDDKINARAAALRRAGDHRPVIDIVKSVTDETIAWYHEDMQALSVSPPDFEPRATEYVPDMITLISRLVDDGFAYLAEGHVLFDVKTYGDYGQLGRKSPDDMIAGARVEVAPYKRNPVDFVLWKPSSSDAPGWDSPWGRGRPGWHIECSAMSARLLGEDFDIHAGGMDLVFPHHENEVAQSRCGNPGSEFARYWMHNGMLRVEGQKMAKSVGNVLTVRQMLDQDVDGDAIRLTLLSAHYRSPLDWTAKRLEESGRTLDKWRRVIGDGECKASDTPEPGFLAALASDLNTPGAMAVLHRLAGEGKAGQLKASAGLLGLFEGDEAIDRPIPGTRESRLIEALLARREAARMRGDYEEADRIRDRLACAGVTVRDGRAGQEWQSSRQPDVELLRRAEAEMQEGAQDG